jgi:hypothetical protein
MKGNCKKMRAPSLLEEVKQVNVAYLSLIRDCRFQMRMADMLSALGNPAESRLGMLRAAALAAVAA